VGGNFGGTKGQGRDSPCTPRLFRPWQGEEEGMRLITTYTEADLSPRVTYDSDRPSCIDCPNLSAKGSVRCARCWRVLRDAERTFTADWVRTMRQQSLKGFWP
jgi:hypothetical protein